MVSTQANLELWDLILSHRVTAIIYIAAKLEVAELLREGPRSLDELAELTKADKEALARLLNALSTVGICSSVNEDQYSLSELGARLDGAAEQSLKRLAIFEGQFLTKSWSGMLESVMTGKTAAQLLGVGNSFDLMARDPENVRMYNAAMADVTRIVTPEILRAYDFGNIAHLMDVGGGSGELIGAVAKKYPHLRATIFDLDRCAESATEHLNKAGVGDRAKFVVGNFFRTIPSIADAIVMKSVIHVWNDELSLAILGNCHKALPKAGTLLLVERLKPDLPSTADAHKEQALSDLNMLRGPGGRERTEAEYVWLLQESGFVHSATYPAGRFGVIEAKVA
jgi:ubiquinone/menaquinone biosynthesis C-methylase UbiE